MNWIEILGAIGFGSFITTILNIFWLPKIMEKIEKRKWLRDSRLKAFSELSKGIMSFCMNKYGKFDPFEFFAIASESMILIDNKELVKRIDEFIARLDALYTGRVGNEKEQEKEYNRLYKEAREIVKALSDMLIKKEVKNKEISLAEY